MKNIYLCWFSAGITSTVACKLALDKFGKDNCVIYYQDTGQVHPDNQRFINDCQNWFGKEIKIVKSEKYSSPIDVFQKTKFINTAGGAPCTQALKKDVRILIQGQNNLPLFGLKEFQVFGFEYEKSQINRAIRFLEQYPDTNPIFPLIEAKLDKNNCAYILKKAGIELPTMYKLGYKNNNCIGCVKGGMGYWNKIKKDFPEIFNKMAKLERELKATAIFDKKNKTNIYLDELKENQGNHNKEVMPECSNFCDLEFTNILSKYTEKILNNEFSITNLINSQKAG